MSDTYGVSTAAMGIEVEADAAPAFAWNWSDLAPEYAWNWADVDQIPPGTGAC